MQHERLPPPASPPRSAPTPKPSAGAISRTAASTAATGWREISTAPAGGRSSSASAVPASPASGPTPRPASTAISSTSSATAPARRRCARRSTRRAPSSPCRLRRPRAAAATTTPPKRRAACGGNAARSTAPTPSAISARADSCDAASRRCASIPSFAIAKARRCAGFRRWSPPSPATTAPCSACSAPGSIRASPPRRAWLCPGRRSGGSSVMRCGSGPSPATASLRSSSARGSKRCSR